MEQQQPSGPRSMRGRGGPEAQGTATGRVGRPSSTGRDDESSSSVVARWTLPLPLPVPVYMVTVDPQGDFHVSPHVGPGGGGGGGPFRSVGEAFAAARAATARVRRRVTLFVSGRRDVPPPAGPLARIYTRKVELLPETPTPSPWSSWEYHVTLRDGLFYAHPPNVGGPFHSLGEAAAAIKCHRTWASATQLLTKGHYFILRKGHFHVRPDGCGGPYKWLDDASDAVSCHRVWMQKEKEKMRKMRQLLDEVGPAAYMASTREAVMEIIQNDGKRDSECPKPEKRTGRDPAILEEADRFERIIAEKELIENGMKWMEDEVLQAFKIYEASSGYRGPKYEFVKLDQQCLIHDSYSKSYHHYNFTMKRKSSSCIRKKRERISWDYQLFFAEVKPTKEGKQFICYPLQHDENGHCLGCQNVGIDLRHPTSGRYEKGQKGSGFPFDIFSVSDH